MRRQLEFSTELAKELIGMHPELSVVMGVYNGERFLRQAIDSVLAQTFKSFELILVNDGSTDSSAEILEQYRAQDPRVVVFSQTNSGIAATLNKAISMCRADLIAHIDQDDCALPEWLEKQMQFLDRHPECSVVSSYSYFINADGNRLGKSKNPVDVERGIAELNPDLFLDVIHSTVLMRKKDLLEVDGYRTGLLGVEDRDLWGRLVTAGKMVRCNPEILVEYRLHGQSATVKKLKESELMSRRGINVNIVRRLTGQKELTPQELVEYFADRPVLAKLKEQQRRSSGQYFRSASRYYADKKWVNFICTFGIAVAIRPIYTLRRALHKVASS